MMDEEQLSHLQFEIDELQDDLDRFGPEMSLATCELIEVEIDRLTLQLKGENK